MAQNANWLKLAALASMAVVSSGLRSPSIQAQPSDSLPELSQNAVSVLRSAMKEGKAFEKVHAAEALIWSGQPEGVREYFLEQDRTASSEPAYRIGIWRVLYRTNAGSPAKQEKYLQRILAVFSDPKASDRGTAAETLGKLKYAGRTKLVLDLAERGKDDLRVSARWILANSGKAADETSLAELLRSNSPKDRYYAAYALRHLTSIQPSTLSALRELAATEPAGGDVRGYVLGALYAHLPADQRESVKRELLGYVDGGNTVKRYDACMALAKWPTADMVASAEKLLGNKPVDERIGGAYLVLREESARVDSAK